MNKQTRRSLYMVVLLGLAAPLALGQGPSGTIRGRITDQQNFPLPGASIYLRSDYIMGMKTFITSDTGKFQFQALLPGTYRLTVEMPGFKSAKIEEIQIHAGQTVRLNIQLEMTTLEEEIVLDLPIPMLDEEGFKVGSLFDFELLRHIPFPRDLQAVVAAAPGVYRDLQHAPAAVITGAPDRNSVHIIDSISLVDPSADNFRAYPFYDAAQEIQVETTGASAEVASSEAGTINIVSRAGAPDVRGELYLQHTNEGFITDLDSPKDLEAQNLTGPASATSLWDSSLSLYGPIYGDLLRFYSQFHYRRENRNSTFADWTDPLGTEHRAYEGKFSDIGGLFRLTGKFTREIKFTGIASYTHRSYPTYTAFSAARTPQESTSRVDPQQDLVLTGWLNYTLSRRTFADVKASYIVGDTKIRADSEGAFKPQYIDAGTGYVWGSASANNAIKLKRFLANAGVLHFEDRVLGGNHKFKLGLDYESTKSEWTTWKHDNTTVYYLDGNPYYFGEEISSSNGGNPLGTGWVAFSLLGKEENSLFTGLNITRLGAYAQDTITLGGRVSLNLGLRFDRTTSSLNASFKGVSSSPLAVSLGEIYIEPLAGLNPYGESQFDAWKDVVTWNILSPRLGIIIDLLGKGRTLLKASYAKSPELLRINTLDQINAYYRGRQHNFFWFDQTNDQEVNAGDAFLPFSEDYRIYSSDYYQRIRSDDLKSPYTEEFMLGIENQFFDDLSVRLSYTYKQKENILEDVLYSPDTDQEWYSKTTDSEDWWIPFLTQVPAGSSEYDGSELTLYYRSRSAPPLFYRLTNVPELKRNYKGLELFVRKRMSHNWQFTGSVVYSKTQGNLGSAPIYADPFSPAANSPNYFVNRASDSPLDYDIPWTVKLMGTYRFPYEFYLGFYYTYMRGRPWSRSVVVIPPEQWAQDNNVFPFPTEVLSESFGSRRYQSVDNLNLRLEKDFRTGWGKLKLALDAFNALGSRYHWFDLDDRGYWYPEDEKTAEGTRVLSSTYGQGINLRGVREFRLSLRLYF